MKKSISFIIVISVLFLMTLIHQKLFSQQTSTMTDSRDGKVYKTVTIGNQTWMAENLNYDTAKGCWFYNNDSLNCKRFGRLYNWETAKAACPSADGWHLPSIAEWDSLIKHLGGSEIAGAKLKSNSYWKTKHDSLTNYAIVDDCTHKNKGMKHDSVLINSSNFNGLPAGTYFIGGTFDYKGKYGSWWTTSPKNIYNSYYFCFFDTSTEALLYSTVNSCGFSVRCIKDN